MTRAQPISPAECTALSQDQKLTQPSSLIEIMPIPFTLGQLNFPQRALPFLNLI